MFEKFCFTEKQIDRHYKSCLRDFSIASKSEIPEVAFRFCYDAIIKLSITICAKNGLRVKARAGHHIELIEKLSEFLKDKEIVIIANEMRIKRNKDLYGEGILISNIDAKDYVKWAKSVFGAADEYLFKKGSRLRL
ncbi:hypothetical protein KJ562_01325 [Patescibacteria group bacterium]|nr:hypothetical protein [Patescibacteria group bacterium]MBU4162476.1 hypothetical protein [Patescibacteria group bacterium]